VGCRNSASSPALAAGERLGRGLGTSGGRFGHLAGTVVAPASGAPAARESGRHGCYSGEGRLDWSLEGVGMRVAGKQWPHYRGSPTRAREGQRRGQRGQASTTAGRRALPAFPCLGTRRGQRGVRGAWACVLVLGGCAA
jgi:hypothetical protein